MSSIPLIFPAHAIFYKLIHVVHLQEALSHIQKALQGFHLDQTIKPLVKFVRELKSQNTFSHYLESSTNEMYISDWVCLWNFLFEKCYTPIKHSTLIFVGGTYDGNNRGHRRKLGYNFVAEDFEGVTLRRTKCLECESVTERKEPFYDIPVPISIKDDEFLDTKNDNDIFRRACVTTEKLCDANKYLCEKCERYNEASREVLFEKLPNIMVLQLKRFTSSTAGVQKVNTFLPTPLEIECFCESCCNYEEGSLPLHRYQLCCVIMHLGKFE